MTKGIDTDTWADISSEKWREYHFPCGGVVRIMHPMRLLVGIPGHGHRILASQGRSWYIAAGWLAITWEADPPFVL